MLTQDQKDNIYNALIVGMTPADAYLLAGLSPEEILWASEDDEMQFWVQQTQKQLEFDLLGDVRQGARKQLTIGKTDATQWLLEKLYPRYSQKASPDTGTINLIINPGEQTDDIVTIVNPQPKEDNSGE